MPIKILHIATGLQMGGAETSLANLMAFTDRAEFEPRVLSLSDDQPVGDRIRALDIPVDTLGMRAGRIVPADFARLTLKMAAHDGFRKACQEGIPVLLVPIMSLTVTVPNEFLGEVIADLHGRKCQITNIAAQDKITVIQANAPMPKMFGYSTDIRSLSQGRASFSMYFSHYDRMEQDSR